MALPKEMDCIWDKKYPFIYILFNYQLIFVFSFLQVYVSYNGLEQMPVSFLTFNQNISKNKILNHFINFFLF